MIKPKIRTGQSKNFVKKYRLIGRKIINLLRIKEMINIKTRFITNQTVLLQINRKTDKIHAIEIGPHDSINE